jgi:small subunit ribosomal protein S20
MPIIKSAKKQAAQNEKRRKRLRPYKTSMKTMITKVTSLVKAKKKAEAEKILPAVYKSIDTAMKKNIIQKRTAARKKSLVMRMVARLK